MAIYYCEGRGLYEVLQALVSSNCSCFLSLLRRLLVEKIDADFAHNDKAGNGIFFYATLVPDAQTIAYLKTKASDLLNHKNKDGRTPICESIQANSSKKLLKAIQLLVTAGADVNICDNNGYSPLIYACKNQSPEECIKFILEHGAAVNTQTADGVTALHFAVSLNRVDLVKLLLSFHALSKRDMYGATPLFNAPTVEIAQQLITNENDINIANDSGTTPLLNSALRNFDIMKLLLQKGASIKEEDVSIR